MKKSYRTHMHCGRKFIIYKRNKWKFMSPASAVKQHQQLM